MRAQVLLIGPWQVSPEDWGGVHVNDLQHAMQLASKYSFESIALSISILLEKKFAIFWEQIKTNNPSVALLVVCPQDFPNHLLIELHNKYHIDIISESFHSSRLEQDFLRLLEVIHQHRQNTELEKMLGEQTEQLERMQMDLENRIEKRTKTLSESRRKLFLTNQRIEFFKKALLSVNEASSIYEIEKYLNETLTTEIHTAWIKIIFHPHDEVFSKQVDQQLEFTKLEIDINQESKKIGTIFYLRSPRGKFTKEETDFLSRITEAVSLAILRLSKLNEIEMLKDQWESTFSSIKGDILLIDPQYEVIQSNDNNTAVGQKCYKYLFDRNTPCPQCQRGHNFKIDEWINPLDSEQKIFEVSSQKISQINKENEVYANFYNDVTEIYKMERQILESSKLAELGTIGSSIAHELNNPLAGILSFAQLIEMDLPKDSPFLQDIEEIKKGALRCKDIIENLLGFTRNVKLGEEKLVDLSEASFRAIKIIHLKSKTAGVSVEFTPPNISHEIVGHINLISQAIRNILQILVDEIINLNQNLSLNLGGKIFLNLESTPNAYNLIISTTKELQNHLANTPLSIGKNLSSPQNLSYSIARQITRDHQGNVEIYSDFSTGTWAKISFTRPVLGS